MEYLCNNCPRMCNVMRAETGSGVCRMGADAVVARAAPHFDEEPVISGTRGSGAVFFSGSTWTFSTGDRAETGFSSRLKDWIFTETSPRVPAGRDRLYPAT